MLEDVLGARSKVRILRSMVSSPDRLWSLDELAGATGLSNGTVGPALKQLVTQGVLAVERSSGHQRVVLSPKHPASRFLAQVFAAEALSIQQATEFLVERAERRGVRYVAWLNDPSQSESPRQTIWLFVVADNPEKVKGRWAAEVSRRPYLYLDVHSADELRQELLHPTSRYHDVISRAQVVYADKGWLGD